LFRLKLTEAFPIGSAVIAPKAACDRFDCLHNTYAGPLEFNILDCMVLSPPVIILVATTPVSSRISGLAPSLLLSSPFDTVFGPKNWEDLRRAVHEVETFLESPSRQRGHLPFGQLPSA
jgi:hypothetical protein